MRTFKNSMLMITAFFCVFITRDTNAKIIWSKDLIPGVNVNSSPLASCLKKDGSGVIVIAIESPKGTFPINGDCALWEIGVDGNAVRILPKNVSGGTVQTNANPTWPGCAIVSDNSGNILTIGILSGQNDETKVAIFSKADEKENIVLMRDNMERFSVKEFIPLQDDTFALVGDRNSDGLYLRIDNQGSIIQEILFDIGHTEKFTGVAQVKSENLSLAVVGISAKISTKDPNENSAENFILIYDSNDKITNDDYFAGEIPMILSPKVCCLDNGNIIVVHKKKSEFSKTRLWARCYTKELKLLWEKEIFVADRFLFSFDVASRGTTGFVVGMAQQECLEFYFLDQDGVKIDYVEQKGVPGGVFGVGLNLIRLNDKTFAVFKEGTAGNIKECTIKAKVIALD